jgi:hypothetical protein
VLNTESFLGELKQRFPGFCFMVEFRLMSNFGFCLHLRLKEELFKMSQKKPRVVI